MHSFLREIGYFLYSVNSFNNLREAIRGTKYLWFCFSLKLQQKKKRNANKMFFVCDNDQLRVFLLPIVEKYCRNISQSLLLFLMDRKFIPFLHIYSEE